MSSEDKVKYVMCKITFLSLSQPPWSCQEAGGQWTDSDDIDYVKYILMYPT